MDQGTLVEFIFSEIKCLIFFIYIFILLFYANRTKEIKITRKYMSRYRSSIRVSDAVASVCEAKDH